MDFVALLPSVSPEKESTFVRIVMHITLAPFNATTYNLEHVRVLQLSIAW